LLILPPGGFIVLGFLIALKNIIDRAYLNRASDKQPHSALADHAGGAH
jgi:hypothetical protein